MNAPGVTAYTRELVQQVLAWQDQVSTCNIPNRRAENQAELSLAARFSKLLQRRDRALGPERSRAQLSPDDLAVVNKVP